MHTVHHCVINKIQINVKSPGSAHTQSTERESEREREKMKQSREKERKKNGLLQKEKRATFHILYYNNWRSVVLSIQQVCHVMCFYDQPSNDMNGMEKQLFNEEQQ